MPIEDELRRLVRERRVDSRHVFVVHPSDFQRLNTALNGDSLLTRQPPPQTLYGVRIITSTAVALGAIMVVEEQTPPLVSSPISPSWVQTPDDRSASLPRPIQAGAGGMPGGAGGHGMMILEGYADGPKSLWDLLAEAEE